MFLRLFPALLLCVCVFLQSCASTGTGGASVAIESLAVAKPRVEAGAFEMPERVYNSPNSGGSGYVPPTVGGGFAAGFAAGAIGYLIHEQINKNKSDAANEDFVEGWRASAQRALPSRFEEGLQTRLKQKIRSSDSLAGKLSEAATSRVQVEVSEYGYRKTGEQTKKILLSPYLAGTVSIVREGKVVFGPKKVDAATFEKGKGGYEVGIYAASQSPAGSHFATAQRNFAAEVSRILEAAL